MIAAPRRPLTEAERQTMAEGIMHDTVQTSVDLAGMVRRHDVAAYKRLCGVAAGRFRQNFGMDATSLRLTDHGLARA